MQLQRQAVRVTKKGKRLAGIFIHANRLTRNALCSQLCNRLSHAVHTESQMAQTRGLRVRQPRGRLVGVEYLQFAVAQAQVQFSRTTGSPRRST